MISLIFFGSFQSFSTETLKLLHLSGQLNITGVVTVPPRLNKNKIIKNPTQIYCEENQLPCYPLESLDTIPDIPQPDFIIVCGYGKILNKKWLSFPKVMAINIHQSLLPNYAGRFPVEWTILNGESQTGLTFIKMNEKFDRGDIIAQYPVPLLPTSTRESVYQELYTLAGHKSLELLPKIISGKYSLTPQKSTGFYARQITKEDGYINPLDLIEHKNYKTLDKKLRALHPWPGVWTHVYSKDGQKLILKIFSATKKDEKIKMQKVQIEGKKPTFWSEIFNYYSLNNPKN